jgi:propionyl-CoA synthetase
MFREEDIMTSRYAEVYESWRSNPEGFWMDQAAAIDWFQAALIYDSPITGSKRTISYNDMLAEVEAFAGALSTRASARATG